MEMLRRPEGQAARNPPARRSDLLGFRHRPCGRCLLGVGRPRAGARRAVLGTQAPQQALSISGVTSRVDISGARPVLFVDGEAANDGTAAEKLPPLDIVVTGNDGAHHTLQAGDFRPPDRSRRNIRLFEPARRA